MCPPVVPEPVRLVGMAENVEHPAIVQAEPDAVAFSLLVEVNFSHMVVVEAVEFFRTVGLRETPNPPPAVVLLHQIAVERGFDVHAASSKKRRTAPSSGRGRPAI